MKCLVYGCKMDMPMATNSVNGLTHVRNRHPLLGIMYYDELKKKDVTQISAMKAALKQYKELVMKNPIGSNNDSSEKSFFLYCWMVKKAIPFNAIADPFFQMAVPGNNFEGLSRHFLSNKAVRMVHTAVTGLQAEALQRVRYAAISVDCWTALGQRDYAAINVCFLTQQFEFRCWLVDLIPLEEKHTALYLAREVAKRLVQRLPKDCLLASTVTDNAAVMILMAKYLHTSLVLLADPTVEEVSAVQLRAVEADEFEPYSFGCVCHSTFLAIKDMLTALTVDKSPLSQLIDNIRQIVLFVKGHHAPARALRAAGINLLHDVHTRWTSTHAMLERFVLVYPKLQELVFKGDLDLEALAPLFPTVAQIMELKDACAVLTLALAPLRIAETQNRSVIGEVAPVLANTLEKMDSLANDEAMSHAMRNFASVAAQTLRDRLGRILQQENVCLVGSALHPQFGHLSFIDDNLRNRVWELVTKWALELRPPPVSIPGQKPNSFRVPPSADTDDSVRASVRAVREYFESGSQRGTAEALWGELTTSSSPNPHFYRLSDVARFVFCIPPSSASTENSFSNTGNIVTRHRTRLLPTRVEHLAVARQYLLGADPAHLHELYKFCSKKN